MLKEEGRGRYSSTFPERHKAVIYRTPLLWESEVRSDVIEFEFAIETASWGAQRKGYKYELVNIFAANGFPWPTDMAQAMRKYSITNSRSLTNQLREAIASAIANTLGVNDTDIKNLKSVITRSTLSLREEKRRTAS